MKKIIISQPMAGKSEKEIIKDRELIVKKLEEKGYKVINNIFSKKIKGKYVNESLYYLAKSIEKMGKAHAIYFMNGWESSRGCKIEHKVAKEYGLEILTL